MRCWNALGASLFLAGTSLFGQVLYVGNAGDDTISAYVIDQQTGFLTELLPRVASTGSPSSVAVHPSGKFVYFTNAGNAALGAGPSLAAFSIDPGTGALTLLSSLPLIPGSGPAGAAIDPAGKFLLHVSGGPSNVSVYAIDASGALSPAPGSPFATPQGPSKVVVHPTGKFAYVSAIAASQIAGFGIGANGALTPVAGSPFAARNNLTWMAMDPAGKFLYAVERQDNAVLVYSIDATTGALTQVGSPFPAGPGVTGLAVDPAGKFLFVPTAGNSGVAVLSIGAGGTLSAARNFGPIIVPTDAILDPAGQFLYLTGQQPNGSGIAAFLINSNTGALTPLPRQFPAGANPGRGASILLNPPVLPPMIVSSAVNMFSHALPGMPYAGIAQGSKMAINGQNLGPVVEVDANDPTLGTELGGVSVQIQSGGVTTAAIMIAAANGFISVVVPSNMPPGDATVTVTYNNRTSPPFAITIVPVSPGIRTLNSEGSGPAKAFNEPGDTVALTQAALDTPNALNQPAKPGQLVLVQGTGLGAANFDETGTQPQELDLPVSVIVGNEFTPAIGTVRVQGSDYIAFKLPADAPLGCHVPIALQAGGATSNVASISVSATGGSCSDLSSLAASDIDAAQKSGQIRMGRIILGHIDFGPFGPNDFGNGIFGRYDFNSLLQTYSPGNNGEGITGAFALPPLGTCTVLPGSPTNPDHLFDTPADPISFPFLNAGSALNLSGPGLTAKMPAPDYTYQPDGNFIVPGDYTVDNGAGTPAVGPFKAALNVPPMVNWTNQGALASVDRTQDLTVTWTGGSADKEFAMILGLSANQQVTGGFLCAEKVSAGQFTVPAWVLSGLPKSDTFTQGDQSGPHGLLGVGTASFTSGGLFSAPGLDFGAITYEHATVNILTYQ